MPRRSADSIGRSLPFRDSLVGPIDDRAAGRVRGEPAAAELEGAGVHRVVRGGRRADGLAARQRLVLREPADVRHAIGGAGRGARARPRRAPRRWRGRRTARIATATTCGSRSSRSIRRRTLVGTGLLGARDAALAHALSARHRRAAGSDHRRVSLERREHVAGRALAVDPHVARPVGRGPHGRRDDRVLDAGRHERRQASDEPDARARSRATSPRTRWRSRPRRWLSGTGNREREQRRQHVSAERSCRASTASTPSAIRSRAHSTSTSTTPGLPGDVVDTLAVVTGGVARADTGVRICTRGDIRRRALGDARTNCTVGNSRLDEEDLDADNALQNG